MSRFSKLEPGGDQEQFQPADDSTAQKKRPRARVKTVFDDETQEGVDYDYFYYCDKGDGAFYTGEPKAALTQYSRALQQDGSKPYPWCMQVLCLIQMGQQREADLWAVRAEEMFPEQSETVSLKAISYASRGMADRAMATSDYALTRGGHPLAWLARGYALLESGSKNAYSCFDKILELPETQNDWKMIALSGLILLQYKKYSQALKPLKRAISLQEDNFYLWVLLGRCFLKTGLTEEAKKAFEQALSLNPRCAEAERSLKSYSSFSSHFFNSLRRFLPF